MACFSIFVDCRSKEISSSSSVRVMAVIKAYSNSVLGLPERGHGNQMSLLLRLITILSPVKLSWTIFQIDVQNQLTIACSRISLAVVVLRHPVCLGSKLRQNRLFLFLDIPVENF